MKNPAAPSGAAGTGRGLGENEMKKSLAVVIAVAVAAALLMLPADARPKKPKRADARRGYELQTQTPSLDGRIPGRTRTCWFETLCQLGAAPTQPACEPSALLVWIR